MCSAFAEQWALCQAHVLYHNQRDFDKSSLFDEDDATTNEAEFNEGPHSTMLSKMMQKRKKDNTNANFTLVGEVPFFSLCRFVCR